MELFYSLCNRHVDLLAPTHTTSTMWKGSWSECRQFYRPAQFWWFDRELVTVENVCCSLSAGVGIKLRCSALGDIWEGGWRGEGIAIWIVYLLFCLVILHDVIILRKYVICTFNVFTDKAVHTTWSGSFFHHLWLNIRRTENYFN